MTRNNLTDQLNWLLRNASLSKPITPGFPSNSDPASLEGSQSQTKSSFHGKGSLPSTIQDSNTSFGAGPPISKIPHVLESLGDAVEDVIEIDWEEANMGRMTSNSKLKKPSLVSLVDQLPTPAPTTESGSAKRGRDVAPPGINLPSSQRKKQYGSPPRTISRRSPLPSLSYDFPDLDGNDWDCMDLTTDNGPSSESLDFGDDVKIWCEDGAKRPEPVPRSAKKRKSNDISKLEPDDEKADFLDVYSLLGTKPPLSTPGSRSAARIRHAAKRSGTARSTSKRLKSPSEGHMSEPSSPLRAKTARRADDVIQQTPQKSTPGRKASSQRETRSTLEEPQPQQKTEPESDEFGAFADDTVIPDSDDEFVTPPSHNTSAIAAKLPELSALRGDVARSRDPSPAPTVGSGRQGAGTEASMPSVPRSSNGPQYESGTASFEAPPSEQRYRLLERLSADLDGFSRSLERLIQQNGQSFTQAINERASKERRAEIRAAKDLLLRRKGGLDNLRGPLSSYGRLCEERKDLGEKVAQSYENGVDTEEDENRLDELTDEIQAVEEDLFAKLAEAGIDEQTLVDLSQPPPPTARPSDIVVPDTQPLTHFSVNMTGSPATSSSNPEGVTEVVQQTQVHADRRIWNEPIPASRINSHGIMSQEDLDLGETPFPRQPSSARKTLKRPVAHGKSAADTHPEPMDTDMPDDFFSDLDDMDLHPPPRSTRKTPQAPRISPNKVHTNRAAEDFSDFSDDEGMLALAQNFESRTSNGPSSASRRTFSEISGNAIVGASSKTASKKKQAAQIQPAIPPELMKHPWSPEVQKKLKDRFRMRGFRHNQLEAINATLAGEDAFVLMPTGGGKSLCYQLPAVIRSGKTRGMTIVVSPLLSLMQDQVDHMKALGIQAVAFNSECSQEYKRQVMGAFNERNPENFVELLYVTPEMISKSPQFSNALETLYRKGKFARLVIDEAHCVSQWGHDFRPDYKAIGQIRKRFPEVPLMALTATATQNVIVDIKHNLNLNRCQVFSQSFNRPNLYYEVKPKGTNANCVADIAVLIQSRYPGLSGIVYAISRKQTEEVASKLSDYGISASHYHAGIEPTEKAAVQTAWQRGEIQVVVATIAFGMGIDKPDVRFVFHHGLPKSLEGYYQETGRAGRDGKPSDCILYYGKSDIRVLKKLIEDGDGNKEQRDRQMGMLNRVTAFCDNKADCRRTEILRYFGEDFKADECNKSCDNCRAGLIFEEQDFSIVANSAIQVVNNSNDHPTPNQVADILRGKMCPDNLHKLEKCYGSASDLKKHEVIRVIEKLLAEKAFGEINVPSRYGVAIQYLELGPRAREFLDGRRKLMLTIQVDDKSVKKSKPKAKKTTKGKGKGKDTSALQSTYVSSPIERRRGRTRVVESDDEDVELTVNGYANDGFVVGDDVMEDEDDDAEEAFAPLPRHRPAKAASKPPQKATSKAQSKPSARKPGPPIPTDTRVEELPELHQDLVHNFVHEAQRLEEQIRNKKEIRRPLFSERDFREMAINWTTSLDKMSRIPGVDVSKVEEHGPKILTILKRFHALYKEMTANPGEETLTSSREQEIVDLISSEGEMMDDDDDDDDDDEEPEDRTENSHYFENSTSRPEVQAFHDRLQSMDFMNKPAPSSSNRGRSSSRGGGYKKWSGGGKKWPKKAGGASNSGGGSRKRGGASGAGSRKASGSSTTASRGSSSGPKRDGKIVRKTGGGIGLMPH